MTADLRVGRFRFWWDALRRASADPTHRREHHPNPAKSRARRCGAAVRRRGSRCGRRHSRTQAGAFSIALPLAGVTVWAGTAMVTAARACTSVGVAAIGGAFEVRHAGLTEQLSDRRAAVCISRVDARKTTGTRARRTAWDGAPSASIPRHASRFFRAVHVCRTRPTDAFNNAAFA